MALAIDATPGGTDSNSFCTLAEANAYHESRLDNESWNSASDSTKTSSLVWAARILDRLRWLGDIDADTQAMRWPRSDVYDQDGRSVAGVPSFLKEAQAELALKLIKDGSADDARELEQIKIGSISLNYGDTTQESNSDLPDEVVSMVAPYLMASGKSIGIVRS